MFGLFKKNKGKSEPQLISPVSGEVIALETVSDPVFSSKMMGDGFAVKPSDGAVYSPVTGKVLSVFPTKHAVTFQDETGLEVLLHIGIDTVSLEGKGFEITVSENDSVTPETKLGNVDLNYLAENGKESTTMVIFTNLAEKDLKVNVNTGEYQAGSVVGSLD